MLQGIGVFVALITKIFSALIPAARHSRIQPSVCPPALATGPRIDQASSDWSHAIQYNAWCRRCHGLRMMTRPFSRTSKPDLRLVACVVLFRALGNDRAFAGHHDFDSEYPRSIGRRVAAGGDVDRDHWLRRPGI